MNPPKMPIHIGDYKRDTGHLRAAQHGAYLMLLFHYWATGSLPDDDDQLSAIACMTRAEWKQSRPIIEKFFDPGWRHTRVEDDLAKAHESYERRAKAGEKGGKATAAGKQCSSNAAAMPQQPLTFNHTQSKQDAYSERERGTRLPPNWALSPDDWNFAKELGWNADQINYEYDKFCDYWHAKTGQSATKTSWSKTWRNWSRRGAENKKPNGVQTRKDRIREEWDDALTKLREFAEAPADGELGGKVIQILPPTRSGKS